VAQADRATTDQNRPVAIDVLANDTDPDGDVLIVSAFSATSKEGAGVACTRAGLCTYTPTTDFHGSDSFTYVASDGRGGSSTGTVTVEVRQSAANRPPVAINDSAETEMNTPIAVDVLSNDSDPDGDSLTIVGYDRTTAHGGSVRCSTGGTCDYEPAPTFSGVDEFTYTVSDSRGGSDTGTVSVTVKRLPVNEPPIAVDDFGSTMQGASLVMNVLGNDWDPDGDPLMVSSFDPGTEAGGAVDCTTSGACTFTPRAGFTGTDRFSYVISDGRGGTDMGRVTVEVVRSPRGLIISEVLPVPQPGDPLGEWVELHNDGPLAAELSGWYVDDGDGGSDAYAIPEGTTIEPGGYLILPASATAIDLSDAGEQVRLLRPDGSVVDTVTFGPLPAGASYSRGVDDVWHEDWPPSPGEQNGPEGAALWAAARLRKARDLWQLLIGDE
jgi:hypothetical protein